MGVAIFAASAVLPVFHLRVWPVPPDRLLHVGPGGFQVESEEGLESLVRGGEQVPAAVLGAAMYATGKTGNLEPLWAQRSWYPYALLPIWGAALLLARSGDRRRRRLAGGGLFAFTVGLAVLEAYYLRADYESFLSGTAGRVESVFAWLLVLAILFFRRRADRGLGAVEATIAAQALLAFVHLLTLPSSFARPWLGICDARIVVEAIGTDFRPAFWIGCAALLTAALPVYLRKSRSALPAGSELQERERGVDGEHEHE